MIIEKHVLVPVNLDIECATLLSVEEYEDLQNYIPMITGWWWLRSPGYKRKLAAYVSYDGSVGFRGDIVRTDYGYVRPALKIKNLKKSGIYPGDELEVRGKEFTVISNKYAISDQTIGCCRFGTTNDYDSSDVKKFVDTWFERLKEQSI